MHRSTSHPAHHRTRRLLTGVVAVAVTAAAYAVAALPANAAANTPGTNTSGTNTPGTTTVPISQRHPQLDWLGSQVAKHVKPDYSGASPDTTQTPGLDVSSYQGSVNWSSVAANGAKFAYVKATEGTYYQNPDFSAQYTGAYDAGLVHGAYHFATPDTSSGAAQADYFVAHGGGWSKDGKTFPGMLDMEWDPYGATCYGLSQTQMTNWILSFSNEYHARTTRWPVIYTANGWWSQCVGSTGDFSSTNPLMVACYCSTPGTMPYAWSYETIWQWADSGTFPGDQDRFNGDLSRVAALANG